MNIAFTKGGNMLAKNIQLTDIEYGSSEKEFELLIEGEYGFLIEIMDKVREKAGMKDLLCMHSNDVYYNFYLRCDLSRGIFDIIGVCNHGEEDDYQEYCLSLPYLEMQAILVKLIEYLSVELYNS